MLNLETKEYQLPLTVEDIENIIPHRYPFLLVDRIQELTKEYAVGYKNVSANEPFFQGHFPNQKIMPGVLIVEALAQLSCAQQLLIRNLPENRLGMFTGIDGLKFRQPVVPGDQLILTIQDIKAREIKNQVIGKCTGIAKVNDKIVCEGLLTFALVPQ